MSTYASEGGDQTGPRASGMLTGGCPSYRVYETRDGRHMALGALEPKFFDAFCEAAGHPELAGTGMVRGEDAQRVISVLDDTFKAKTQQEWVELLQGVEACCEPVLTFAEALTDEGVCATSVQRDGAPVVFTHVGVPPDSDWDPGSAPGLGEHGREVLEQLGVPPDLIRTAGASGAVVLDDHAE
jgi:crotonobetainyl-CoA:carnitine CoA-transferase CaiB-like acyl-CoA transferase